MKRLLFLLPAFLAFQVSASPALAWTWPADGPVLRHFQFGSDPYAAGQHRGIDIAAHDGADVVAPASGLVTFGGTVPSGGRTLTIETSSGYAVTLLHLGAISARKGESVIEGAVIGTAGRSGVPEHDAVYVHLGVRLSADRHGYVDPLSLLPPRTDEAQPVPATSGPSEGSQVSTSVDAESEGKEGTAVSTTESASAELTSVGTSSAIPSVEESAATAVAAAADVPAAHVQAVAAGVSADASFSEGVPTAPEPEVTVTTNDSAADVKSSEVSSGDEGRPLATETPAVELAISPQTLAELGLTAGESQAIQALIGAETTAVPVAADPSKPVEMVTVLDLGTDAQSTVVPLVSGSGLPATDGSAVGDLLNENAGPDTPAGLPAGENPAAQAHVGDRSHAESASQGDAVLIRSSDKPADSSGAAPREKASTKPVDGREKRQEPVTAPVAPVGQASPVASAGRAWLQILRDNRFTRSVDPVVSAPTVGWEVSARRPQTIRPDVQIRPQTSAEPLATVLIAVSLVVGLSSGVIVALLRFRRREGSAGKLRSSESMPVAPSQVTAPCLPELSESERIALDAELKEILVSPAPIVRGPGRSGVVTRV